MNLCRSYISGKWRGGGKTLPIRNPADVTESVGEADFADSALVVQAADAAQEAWTGWRKLPVAKRLAYLRQILVRLQERRMDFARTITRENGKTLLESGTEVDASVYEATYQLDFLEQALVETCGGHEIRYEPLGVALLITPWNFPLATVLRKMIPALATGNTVVVKASELTPMTGAHLFELIDEIGLPPGVANLVIGDGKEVGQALVDHAGFQAVSFTGSTATGRALAQAIGGRDVRLQAEMGGSNAVVILADADLEAATDAVAINGFACCGQWCTGTGRVIIERAVYEEVLERLTCRARAIVVGNGMEPDTTMGPLISAAQLRKVGNAVKRAVAEGARLVCGGKRASGKPLRRGHFFEPTVLADVTGSMSAAREEIFGPVLALLPARDENDALELTNATPYGLAFSVFTRDMEKAERFMCQVEAGVCHVNLPTAYREPALPLLGWRDSGRGLPESGRFARDFFTKTKAVYRGQG